MKTIVCIVVYNRYDNLRHWLECWNKCYTYDAEELVIIINRDNWGNKTLAVRFSGPWYVETDNVGYDVGRFQDFCKGTIEPVKWDRMLWLTDDVFPMSTDFIKQFNDTMQPGVGVACMEISKSVKPHIRTSAFMIDRTVAERLKFPADPITTKRQCYEFEHMGKNTLYDQIIKMGLKVVQVAPNDKSPLWDSGYARKLDRRKEHEAIFGPMPDQPEFIPKSVHLKNEA